MRAIKRFSNFISRYSFFQSSLRARVAFGVALPIFFILMGLSLAHYLQELRILENQAGSYAAQLGDILANSISHTMVTKESEHLSRTISDVNRLENVQQVQIVGISGKILAEKGVFEPPGDVNQQSAGCWECHQYPADERPRSLELSSPTQTLRISTPISNQPECLACHHETGAHLGVLLIDMSLASVQKHTFKALYRDMAITVLSTVLITMGLYALINRFVVRRIESLQKPIAAYTAGDHSIRIPEYGRFDDEICQLADTFNQMADEIERHMRQQEERSRLRQRAIIDERERIARELHDGLAQVLGYVSTKAMAVRLNIQKYHLEEADRQLFQLEEAARGLSLDVREGILGLKMASQVDTDLVAVLREYVDQFNHLSNIPAEFDPPAEFAANLVPEEVLHLLRVVQESLTNARKYADATRIEVSLSQEGNTLCLSVTDNGHGFDLEQVLARKNGNFGLTTMKERTEEIGAKLEILSKPGHGTRVSVTFDLEGERS
ncbi:MAG: HAMP domain-containing protein [Chloroflexi bacterium]|nr:HAMP domain-containing protein [Chloroflexota bacterium]